MLYGKRSKIKNYIKRWNFMKVKVYESPVMKLITMQQCDVVRTSEPVSQDATNPFVDDLYFF